MIVCVAMFVEFDYIVSMNIGNNIAVICLILIFIC